MTSQNVSRGTSQQRTADSSAPVAQRTYVLDTSVLLSDPRALFRFAWRRRMGRLQASGRLSRTALWAPWLGIRADVAATIAGLSTLGAVLAATEAASPMLAYRPLRPAELPGQIRGARLVLNFRRLGRQVLGRSRMPKVVAVEGAPPLAAERTGHA